MLSFCDRCDEEDTASVLAWVNNANVKGAYRVNFFLEKRKTKTIDWLIDWLLIICFVALQVTYIILKNIEKDIFYYI